MPSLNKGGIMDNNKILEVLNELEEKAKDSYLVTRRLLQYSIEDGDKKRIRIYKKLEKEAGWKWLHASSFILQTKKGLGL
jgi:hypothetical protein